MIDDRLALSVTHSDGTTSRWGFDEPDAEDIPGDLSFSSSIPGGFRDLSCSLLRRIDLDYADQNLFDDIRAYGPGNVTAWNGLAVQHPRSHGAGFAITPGAVGWAQALKWDPSFREVYRDINLGQWAPASSSRRLAVVTAGRRFDGDGTVATDVTAGSPSLRTTVQGAWAAAANPISESWYDAGAGLTIASLYYAWKRSSTVSSVDTNWTWQASLDNTDDATGTADTTGNLRAVGPGSGTLTATTTNRRWARVQLFYTTGGAGDATFDVHWTTLAVYGGHGLAKRGTEPVAGFYASDVIADVITRAAPMLSYSTGAGGSIEPTDFVIPHLVFADPVTAEDAILFVNAYHMWEWGVYDNREFFYRPPDPDRLTWEARLSEGAHLDLEGDTAEQIFNGIVVYYQDATGQRKSVGPPASYWHNGTALTDATSTFLVDTSETNPVNAQGIPRRWAKLEISQPTTQAGAEQLGYVWLAEHSLPQRRGNLTLTGTATHPIEGPVPVWRIRAGDYIRISDHPADVPRRIIETSYNHGQRSISCSLDNTSLKLDAIIERALGVQMVGVL